MLLLTRKPGEQLRIGDDIIIKVVDRIPIPEIKLSKSVRDRSGLVLMLLKIYPY